MGHGLNSRHWQCPPPEGYSDPKVLFRLTNPFCSLGRVTEFLSLGCPICKMGLLASWHRKEGSLCRSFPASILPLRCWGRPASPRLYGSAACAPSTRLVLSSNTSSQSTQTWSFSKNLKGSLGLTDLLLLTSRVQGGTTLVRRLANAPDWATSAGSSLRTHLRLASRALRLILHLMQKTKYFWTLDPVQSGPHTVQVTRPRRCPCLWPEHREARSPSSPRPGLCSVAPSPQPTPPSGSQSPRAAPLCPPLWSPALGLKASAGAHCQHHVTGRSASFSLGCAVTVPSLLHPVPSAARPMGSTHPFLPA